MRFFTHRQRIYVHTNERDARVCSNSCALCESDFRVLALVRRVVSARVLLKPLWRSSAGPNTRAPALALPSPYCICIQLVTVKLPCAVTMTDWLIASRMRCIISRWTSIDIAFEMLSQAPPPLSDIRVSSRQSLISQCEVVHELPSVLPSICPSVRVQ